MQAAGAPSSAGGPAEGMRQLRRRLIVSLIFTVPLFYVAMGEMWGFPMPPFLSGMENAMVYAFTQFLLVIHSSLVIATFARALKIS